MNVCNVENEFGTEQETIKWQKLEDNDVIIELTTSSYLQINFLQDEDIGLYICVIKTEYGENRAKFELKFDPTGNTTNLDQANAINFVFIELDVRPMGQVIVKCETGESLDKNTIIMNPL